MWFWLRWHVQDQSEASCQIFYWITLYEKLVMCSSKGYKTLRHKRWRHHRSASLFELKWPIPRQCRILCPKDPKCKMDNVNGTLESHTEEYFAFQHYYGAVLGFDFLLWCNKTQWCKSVLYLLSAHGRREALLCSLWRHLGWLNWGSRISIHMFPGCSTGAVISAPLFTAGTFLCSLLARKKEEAQAARLLHA